MKKYDLVKRIKSTGSIYVDAETTGIGLVIDIYKEKITTSNYALAYWPLSRRVI